MKVRNETFVVFKIFKSIVENLKDFKINTLCLDWGGEYISKEFIEFCQQHGIVQQLTIMDTLHQNGVVGECTLRWTKNGTCGVHNFYLFFKSSNVYCFGNIKLSRVGDKWNI